MLDRGQLMKTVAIAMTVILLCLLAQCAWGQT
jgi:hypothetical protein